MSRSSFRWHRRRVCVSSRSRRLWFEVLEDRRVLDAALELSDSSAAGLSETLDELPTAAQYAISAAIGQDQAAYHASADAAGWTLANPAQAFTAEVQAGALQIFSGADRWQMTLEGFGYGGTIQPATD